MSRSRPVKIPYKKQMYNSDSESSSGSESEEYEMPVKKFGSNSKRVTKKAPVYSDSDSGSETPDEYSEDSYSSEED